jgi:disulfide bond formation protein DsbB
MIRKLYLVNFLICLFLLSFALFIQHVGWQGIHYPPCPLCILQRIGFLGIGISSLLAYFFTPIRKLLLTLSLFFSVYGLGIALRHAWVISHPEVSCGIDPLEVFINQFEIVSQMPYFFKADGFCSMPLPPILFLTVPQWSLVFFSGFLLMLLWALLKIFRMGSKT